MINKFSHFNFKIVSIAIDILALRNVHWKMTDNIDRQISVGFDIELACNNAEK